jgi:pectate lyase
MLTAFMMAAGALGAPPDSIPVSFTLDEPGYVTLVIEDSSGRRVRNLVSGEFFPAGTHTVPWDGHDESKPLEKVNGAYPADADGVFRDHGAPVQPGAYAVRGIVRPRIRLSYEMTAYKSSPVTWNKSGIGGWLADHTPPSSVLYVPRGRKRFDLGAVLDPTRDHSEEPSILIGAYAAEAGNALVMTDLDGNKYDHIGGFGAFVGAGLMARDPKHDDQYYAYVAAITRATDAATHRETGRLHLLALSQAPNVSRNRFNELWACDGVLMLIPEPDPGEAFFTKKEAVDVIPGLTVHDNLAAMAIASPRGVGPKAVFLINVATGPRPVPGGQLDPGQLTPTPPEKMSKVAGEIPFEAIGAEVRGLAFDKEGRLLVLTPESVKRYNVVRDKADDTFTTAGLEHDRDIITGGLEDARYIICDYLSAGGDLYIAQHGNSHQVKRFSADGTLVRVFGEAGPVGIGRYNRLHMNQPTGLAVTPKGELWVTEHDFLPKRVSVWNIETGGLIKDVLGPVDYGGGGTLDPADPARFYIADYHAGMMELKLDRETGAGSVERVLWRPSKTDKTLFPRRNVATDVSNFGVPLTPVRFEGRTYFTNIFYETATTVAAICGIWLLDDANDRVKLVAAVGNAYGWPRLTDADGGFRAKWPADINWTNWAANPTNYQNLNPVMFTWSDLNGDGEMDVDEVGFKRIPDAKRFGGMTLNVVEGRLTAIESYNWSVAHSEITAEGVPVFKAEDIKLFMVDIPKETTANDKFISYAKTGFATFPTPEGYMVTVGCPIQGFKKDSSGKGVRAWTYPNIWSSLHEGHDAPNPPQYPGQLVATTRPIAPPFQIGRAEDGQAGSIWTYNCDRGAIYLFTADGLYIDTLFSLEARAVNWMDLPALERGFDLTEIAVPGENFWPSITKADDGNVYITTGKNHASLVRVTGLDQIKRVDWGVLQLKAGDIPQSQTYTPAGESDTLSITIRPREDNPSPANPPPLAVDGRLDEWAAMEWVRIEPQTYAAIATDGGRLYLAYQSFDGALGRNTTAEPPLLFKTGGAFDLMLRTTGTVIFDDNVRVKDVVDGDTRVVIALNNAGGSPAATLYRTIDSTATGPKTLFSSPVGEVYFDRVDEINDRITFAQSDRATAATGNVFPTLAEPPELHAYEMSIDLAVLGIAPKQGRFIRGDIGVIVGGSTASTARFYWKNKASGLANDIPGEATLMPVNWGVMEVRGPAPVVEKNPVSQIVAEGERVVINAGVSGWQPMTWQWEKSPSEDGAYTAVPGGGASYIIPAAAVSDSGWYRVTATNEYGGETSAPAELVVRPSAFPAPAPDGYGAGATGGGGAPGVLVSSFEELRARAESEEPLVINIRDNITLPEPVHIKSNKTIQGIDANATISGGLVLGGGVDNVIIRGLNISNPAAGGIGVDIDGARNVFITHCSLFDCAGGCVRVTNASENVTVSWSEFYYASTPGGPAMLAGTAGDAYPPHVTLHHNAWRNIASAMPLAVASRVHMYNNHFSAANAAAAAASSAAGAGAEILSEYNIYDSIITPLVKSATTAGIRAVSNEYNDSGPGWDGEAVGGGLVFSPGYSYTLQLAGGAAASVAGYAGNTAGADSTAPASAASLRIEGADGVFAYGKPFVFTSTMTGGPAASYQWRRDNFDLPGATGASYAEDAADASSSGAYVLQAGLADGGGLATSNPKFVVTGQAPVITRQPDSSMHSPIYPPLKEVAGVEGKDVSLYVIATGEPVLGYQWQKLNGAGYQDIAGAVSHTLKLNRVASGDEGSYRVIVTNDFGTAASSAITLTVSPAGNASGGGGGGGGACSLAGLGLVLVLLAARRRSSNRP